MSGKKTFMRYDTDMIILFFILIILYSCKKDNNSNPDCFPNTPTVRQITNARATVKKAGEKFYIVEQGSIDTKLNPCTLNQDFQIDNLQVTISGDVKSTVQGGSEPCCTENFVITNISK